MKNLVFVILIVLGFCSCTSGNVGFYPISKMKIMESWAWRIFIFTCEGEFRQSETVKKNFDDVAIVKPIFVEDTFGIYNNDDTLLFSNVKVAFKDRVVNPNFAETKRKK
ncbi:hypothetical protein [Flavobacterium taihuense]|uniref:Lipoprotein n=1 Tax=Flavobacterium taihuense TaxID=2857508 RepID=A0ABS6XX58_9FLAO|nr:hypothetical protein [Flavobacterium taihuense]MBW4361273.1 hypothetical protein [Flavobacterium taihuense]